MMQRVASNGFVRNKLTVLHGGGAAAAPPRPPAPMPRRPRCRSSPGTLAVADPASVTVAAPTRASNTSARRA